VTRLTVFDPIGKDAQRKYLDLVQGGVTGITVSHDSWQLRNISDPTAIRFQLNLNAQSHNSIIRHILLSNAPIATR
jgi:hypothetical protein